MDIIKITSDLINSEKSESLKKIYKLALDFKAKNNLESVELFNNGLHYEILITPSMAESDLEEISTKVDNYWTDYDEEVSYYYTHDGCYFGFVSNKESFLNNKKRLREI
jgi:hypothetical protein